MRTRTVRKFLVLCLLSGFGVVLAGALMEVYLRAVTKDLDMTPGMVRSHPVRRYELVPGFRGWTYDKPVRINSLGLRDVETSITKPRDLFRIVCLGDSATFGHGVRAEDTYPKQLERLIKERNVSTRAEVLNFGVPGYNTAWEVSFLKEKGIAFGPDIVILEFTVYNDAETIYFATPVGRRPLNKLKDQFRRLYLYNFLARKYYALTQRVATLENPKSVSRVDKIRKDFAESNLGWKAVVAALDEFFELSSSYHFRPIVMIFPIVESLDDYPYGFAHRRVRAAVADRGEVVDLLPYFQNHRAQDLWVSAADGHPNRLAHEIMAAALYDALNRVRVLK